MFSSGVYIILRKLKGMSYNDVLSLSIPQFYYLINCIAEEVEQTNKQIKHKKGKK